jgi:hypothetical protein
MVGRPSWRFGEPDHPEEALRLGRVLVDGQGGDRGQLRYRRIDAHLPGRNAMAEVPIGDDPDVAADIDQSA